MTSAIVYALNTGRWSYISERWITACEESFYTKIPELPQPFSIKQYASWYNLTYDQAKREILKREFLKIGKYYIEADGKVWKMYTDAKNIESVTRTRISIYSLIRALNDLKSVRPRPFASDIEELIGKYAMNKLTRMGILGSIALPEYWGDNRRVYYITNYFEI